MGPLTDTMKRDLEVQQRDYRYHIEWTTPGEYLELVERRGVAPNIASFVGAAGSAELVRVLGLRNPAVRRYTGRTITEIARSRGQRPESAMVDLVLEDDSRVAAAYTLMPEANIERQLEKPWVSICSDAEALAPHGVFLSHHPHPCAHGSFARFLGRYLRDQQLLPLAEAVRRLTALPAVNLKLPDRGRLVPDAWAELVVFDPARVADLASFAEPQQFARGMQQVFVNGVAVLRDGAMSGARRWLIFLLRSTIAA